MNNIVPPAQLGRATPLPAVRPQSKEPQKQSLMRRYECLTMETSRTIIAPATPLFEAAFSAFARGTVFKTDHGPCPVEDLFPGMMLETVEYGAQPLLWRGAMNIVPNTPCEDPDSQRLARVMQGSFGFARPESDLMLGPAATVVRPALGNDAPQLVPIKDLVDGHTVFRTQPPSTVQVFHLVLPQQCSLIANGVQLASYHPPLRRIRGLGPNMKQLFMSFFGHVRGLEGFGKSLQGTETPAFEQDLRWA